MKEIAEIEAKTLAKAQETAAHTLKREAQEADRRHALLRGSKPP